MSPPTHHEYAMCKGSVVIHGMMEGRHQVRGSISFRKVITTHHNSSVSKKPFPPQKNTHAIFATPTAFMGLIYQLVCKI